VSYKIIVLVISGLMFASCLKTRSELGESYQSQVYSKKQSDNQKDDVQSVKTNSNESNEIANRVDEKDELIRNLNGRIESLENQIAQLNKDKENNTDSQKVQILQDSLIKMEAQLAKLEHEISMRPSDEKIKQDVDASAQTKEVKQAKTPAAKAVKQAKNSSFESAQEYFAQKDFKHAILEYQKFVDTNPKSKLLPEAKYKIGLCFESMGLKDEAHSFYEEVAAQYGASDFGKKAKLKISKNKKK